MRPRPRRRRRRGRRASRWRWSPQLLGQLDLHARAARLLAFLGHLLAHQLALVFAKLTQAREEHRLSRAVRAIVDGALLESDLELEELLLQRLLAVGLELGDLDHLVDAVADARGRQGERQPE